MIELRDLPEHSSYSQVDTLLTCGEKYFLQKGTTLPNLPSWALLGGSAIHSATEELDCALFRDGVGSVASEYDELFRAHLSGHLRKEIERNGYQEHEILASGRASKLWPEKENRAWWEHHGPGMLASWVEWRDNNPWQLWQAPDGQWAIELELEAQFGGQTIKLAIDRVFEGWGQLIVVDIKSGREPRNQFQLGMYAEAIYQKYGIRPAYGSYWLARTGAATTAANLGRFDQAYLDMTFRKFKLAKDNGIFLPHPSNLCGSCGVRDFCTAEGSRAHEVPRPYMEV